jgi:hypothetical protein
MALQMMLDSCAPWASLPVIQTPVSSLQVEKANAPGDTSSTTQNDPFQLNQATTTSDCPDTSVRDESSLPVSPLQLGQENPEDDILKNGILEELDALDVPGFGPRHLFDSLGHDGSPTADTGHSPSPPPLCFPVESLAFRQCLDLYFERFHARWPIVHKGTFDPTTTTGELVSSMIMIGAWESGIVTWMELAERLSESLVNRLSKNLVRIDLLMKPAAHTIQSQASSRHGPVSECTLQAYQALLLNVIFTLEYSV